MELSDILKNTNTNYSSMLSEILETQCHLKGLLFSILSELAKNDDEKIIKMVQYADKIKDDELLGIVARFSSNEGD